jgi:hypothetical protein
MQAKLWRVVRVTKEGRVTIRGGFRSEIAAKWWMWDQEEFVLGILAVEIY